MGHASTADTRAAALPLGSASTSRQGAETSGPRSRARPVRPRHFVWFTPALGLLLAGYLFFSKSFAYVHIPGTPVFIGEVVLAIGLVEVLGIRSPWRHLLATSFAIKVLLIFMGVCALRLAGDLSTYRLDAVRDSSVWYYGAYALIAAAAVVREETFLPRLLRWYRLVLPAFLVWAPIAIVAAGSESLSLITVPGTSTPANTFKPNDMAVHIALALGFLWLRLDLVYGRPLRRSAVLVLSVIGVLGILVAAAETRGGFVAAVLTLVIVFMFMPAEGRRRTTLSVSGCVLVVIALLLLTGLEVPGERRDTSLQQVASNVASIAGQNQSEELAGTVEWREQYWEQVLADLRGSPRILLTGVGFGPILPERYDVDAGVENPEHPLRSAHNSHLTLLARVGLPGFALWAMLWVVWCRQIFRWMRRRPGGIRAPDVPLAAWLLAAAPGFLANAFFDPSLEGPHAAIWLYTVLGVGAAYTRRRPDQRLEQPTHPAVAR